MKFPGAATVVFTTLLGALVVLGAAHATPRQVSLQLLWDHQFQFAGYYAAQAKGFYANEGLEVELKHGGYGDSDEAVNPVEEVVFGRADFGITRSDVLLERMLGLPVVALAAIYQRSPFILITTTGSGVRRLEDVGDKPVMLSLPEGQGAPRRIDVETLAMLKHAGIDHQQLNNRRPSWNYADLVSGKTTLMPGYITDSPLFVQRAGGEPVVISPLEYGVDFYGDVLFTSEHMLASYPDVVARLRRASLKGWQYALEHPAEVIDYILATYYPDAGPEMRRFLQYEAQKTIELVQADLVEVGYMSRERWDRIQKTFVSLGLVPETLELEAFLYDPVKTSLWQEYRVWIVGLSGVFAVILAIMLFILHLNRALRQQIVQREQLERSLKETNRKLVLLSDTDSLTGLYNRRYTDRVLEQEIKQAERYGDPLTVALLDVDNFKQVNDNFGHACGDEALVAVARRIRAGIREVDIAGRYGGEEFLLLFPKLALDDAATVMERLRSNMESIVVEGRSGLVTISAGIAVRRHGETLSRLLSRADKLLYRAKQEGRNQVMALEAGDEDPVP